MKRSGALTHMTHVHRTTVIRSGKTSQPVHSASSASFVPACCNALNRAIAIFLRVRQQLERIRSCVRFEQSDSFPVRQRFPAHCPYGQFHPFPLSRKLRKIFRGCTWHSFLPICFLKTLPIAMRHCNVGTAYCLGTAIRVRTSSDLFQNLFEGRLLLPLTLLSFLFFLSSVRQNLPCQCPS